MTDGVSVGKKSVAKFGEWISVKDELPEPNGQTIAVLICGECLGVIDEVRGVPQPDEAWYVRATHTNPGDCVVTHWYPIPSPPAERGDAQPADAETTPEVAQ